MIILILGKAGQGKDTVAKFIKEELPGKTVITHYADYLKFLCTQFCDWDGIKDEQGRRMLQTIGTDLVRQEYNEDFWVDRVIEQIEIFSHSFNYFVVPDARFLNEIIKIEEHFKEKRIITIRIERPAYKSKLTSEQEKHPSEIALDDYIADYTIVNTTLDYVQVRVKDIVYDILNS